MAVWGLWKARESERQASAERRIAIADESRALTGLSQLASSQGHYTDAVLLALAAWPRSGADERPQLSRTIDALGQALVGPLEVWSGLHEKRVSSASFSLDGTRVVTASEDKTAQVWDAATGRLIGQPLQHANQVDSAAFSPDGARVVTASEDKTARVWDAATGAPIGKPLQHEDAANSAVFSPDGTRVVTASEDSTARIWMAPPVGANIIAAACKTLRNQGTGGLFFRYGIDVVDPICVPDAPVPNPVPNPSRMIDR